MQDENAVNAQTRPQQTPKRTPSSKKRKNPDGELATPATPAAKRRALTNIASPNTPLASQSLVSVKKEPRATSTAVYSDGTGVQLLAGKFKEDIGPASSQIDEISFTTTTAAVSMLDTSIEDHEFEAQFSAPVDPEREQFVTVKEEDKESVLGALYLGNSEVASNHDWLRIEDIKAVVNAAVELKEFQYPCESYKCALFIIFEKLPANAY